MSDRPRRARPSGQPDAAGDRAEDLAGDEKGRGLTDPPTPAAALFRHADLTPEDPWLFRREGWDWRWMSFRAAAEAVATPQEGPGAAELTWQSVLADLSVQAAGGPVAVRGPAGRVELAESELADAAAKIAGLIPPGKIRDILVLGGSLDDPPVRALLSWATVAGAALLLEPDPGNVLGMAVWARPTVFAGPVADAVRLRLAAQRHEQGWARRLARRLGRRTALPWGRLRALLLTEPGPLPQEDENYWRERGVAAGFLPQCGIAWYISQRGDRHA